MDELKRFAEQVMEYPPLIYLYFYVFMLPIASFLWLIFSFVKYLKTPKDISEFKEEQKNKTLTALGIFVFIVVLSVLMPAISLIAVPVMTILSFLLLLFDIGYIFVCPQDEKAKHFKHIIICGGTFLILLLSTILFVIVLMDMPPIFY